MYRSIETDTWSDPWFSELGAPAKLIFLYLITNGHVDASGCCEVTLRFMAFETGLEQEQLTKIIPKLAPQVIWWKEHNIFWVRNFLRRQAANTNPGNFRKSGAKSLVKRPDDVIAVVQAEYPVLVDILLDASQPSPKVKNASTMHSDASAIHVETEPVSVSVSEQKQKQKKEIEPTVLARAPREPSAKQSTHMSIVQALQESCNWDTSKPGTKNELARLHANAKQIADAGGTAEDVQVRAEHYIERWGADKLTPNSLIGHWTECASEPPARASPNGYRPVTITEQKLKNTLDAHAEFERITDEQESLQRADGKAGDRVRGGSEHRAIARVLGSGEKPQR